MEVLLYNSSTTKPCTQCKVEKPLSDFHLKPNGVHGYDSICKLCVSKRKKINYRRKIQKHEVMDKFTPIIIGNINEEIIESFGQSFGQSLCALIERGYLQ